MNTSRITLKAPSLDDVCPYIPEGATDYERQEIGALWRNALVANLDAINRLRTHRDHLLAKTENRVELHPFGNDAQKVAQAIGYETALAHFLNAVHHRIALAERES